MSEKILSNDEVDALLDGVESGEIEIQSAEGPRYASVTPYEIPQRSRITSTSFPGLELLNEKFAGQLRKKTQQLLHCDLGLNSSETAASQFGDIRGQHDDVLIAVEFAAPPLPGHAAIVFGAELVHQLVELFFGGAGSEPKAPGLGGFTPGELRVIHAYSDIVLATLKEMWEPFQEINPEHVKTESSISLLNFADETDQVIQSTFDFSFEEHEGAFHLLLPNTMVETLLPRFKGTSRQDDPAQDEMWAETIRTSLMDTSVELASRVGNATMTLAELICLKPGDIINIDNPRIATIAAQNLPLLLGRFGVLGGCNAVEATQWLGEYQNDQQRNGTNG